MTASIKLQKICLVCSRIDKCMCMHQYRSLNFIKQYIPFNLSSELSQQLACTVADRFNIVNNTSILGSVDTYCKECSTLTRDEEDKQESVRSKIILLNTVINANGRWL